MRSLFKKNDFPSQADEEASAAKPSRQLDNPLHASLRANDFPSASSSAPSTGSGQQRRPSLRSTAPPLVAATGRLALQPPDVHLALGRTPRGQSEELARESITSTVNACLGQAWEPSTQQTYNSTLSVNVGGAEIRLGAELLPMDSDSKLMAAFASMDGKPWGSTRVLKAAVRAWHESRNAQDLFSAAWTSTAFRFWRGLKKRADHTKSNAKIAVSLEEFDSFVLACVGRSNASGLRDAAAAGVCFFWYSPKRGNVGSARKRLGLAGCLELPLWRFLPRDEAEERPGRTRHDMLDTIHSSARRTLSGAPAATLVPSSGKDLAGTRGGLVLRHREERNPGAELRLLAETRGSPLRFFGDRHALAAQRRRALVSQHRQDPGRRHPSPRWMGRSKNDARSVLSPNGSRKALGDLICGVGRHLCGSCFNGPNPAAGGIFFLELDLLVGRLSSGPCSIGAREASSEKEAESCL